MSRTKKKTYIIEREVGSYDWSYMGYIGFNILTLWLLIWILKLLQGNDEASSFILGILFLFVFMYNVLGILYNFVMFFMSQDYETEEEEITLRRIK